MFGADWDGNKVMWFWSPGGSPGVGSCWVVDGSEGQRVEQSLGLLQGSAGVEGCSHLSHLRKPTSSFRG